jgi:hypothetical protein
MPRLRPRYSGEHGTVGAPHGTVGAPKLADEVAASECPKGYVSQQSRVLLTTTEQWQATPKVSRFRHARSSRQSLSVTTPTRMHVALPWHG